MLLVPRVLFMVLLYIYILLQPYLPSAVKDYFLPLFFTEHV